MASKLRNRERTADNEKYVFFIAPERKGMGFGSDNNLFNSISLQIGLVHSIVDISFFLLVVSLTMNDTE